MALAAGLPAAAATPSEFYLGMLRKGVAAYDANRFDSAIAPLRIAAFGFVDSVEYYQTAQIYLALAHNRLGNVGPASDAARRVVMAERIEPKYASLPLPAQTRTNFETAAAKMLSPQDAAILRNAKPTTTTATQPQTPPVQTPPVQTPPPAAQPAPVQTAPPQTATAQPDPEPQTPAVSTPPASNPAPTNPRPANPQPSNPQPSNPATPSIPATQPSNPATQQPSNPNARFAAAEQALTASNLIEARAIYRELLEVSSLQRADLLRLAEGFYRARDFANALRAFERLGALRRGEEPYRYYIAVALYEIGQYARAKEELATVLPFIEVTPDVARYRAKIEGARN